MSPFLISNAGHYKFTSRKYRGIYSYSYVVRSTYGGRKGFDVVAGSKVDSVYVCTCGEILLTRAVLRVIYLVCRPFV